MRSWSFKLTDFGRRPMESSYATSYLRITLTSSYLAPFLWRIIGPIFALRRGASS